jgi:hypothetical protein
MMGYMDKGLGDTEVNLPPRRIPLGVFHGPKITGYALLLCRRRSNVRLRPPNVIVSPFALFYDRFKYHLGNLGLVGKVMRDLGYAIMMNAVYNVPVKNHGVRLTVAKLGDVIVPEGLPEPPCLFLGRTMIYNRPPV